MELPEEVHDPDLYVRTQRLLEPGEIELAGLIAHTTIPGSDDLEMTQLTIDVGDVIADHATDSETETFVYSGSDDPEFAVNQHQGRTLDDESFVWECQQLLRNGSYDLVFYFEADADLEAVVEAVEDLVDGPVVGVTES